MAGWKSANSADLRRQKAVKESLQPRMKNSSDEEKVFAIIYKLTHLAELYDQFVAFSAEKNIPVKTLEEFANELASKGNPYGDRLTLKRPVETNSIVPIFELYRMYEQYPERPEITMEEFIYQHRLVDKFRRQTGTRNFIKD